MDYLHPTWRTWLFLIVLLGPSGLRERAFFHCRRLKRNRLDRERLPIEPPSYGIGCHQWSGKLTLWSYSKESSKRTSIILHLECENDRCEVKTTLFASAFLITLYIPTMYFSVLIHYSVCSSVLLGLGLGLGLLDWMPGLSSWLTGQHHITNLIWCACIYLYVNYGTHCTPYHPWKKRSPTMRFFSRFLSC
jgi:hypothetical protein